MSYGFQMFVVLVSCVLSYRQLGLLCLKSFIVTWSYLIQQVAIEKSMPTYRRQTTPNSKDVKYNYAKITCKYAKAESIKKELVS